MAKLPGAYEYMATVGAPAINFGRGLLGYQDPFMTQTMQDRMAELEAEKGTTGNIGYEDYGLKTATPGGRFTGGLMDLAVNNPTDFGLAGSIGRYSFSPEGRTGLNYDFTPDQDTGSTGSAMLDFINAGGLKGAFSRMGTAQASDLPGIPSNSLERDFPGMSTGDIINSMNNRQAANRYSGMGQVGPNKSDMIGNTIAEAMIDEDRIPGRNQKEVPNYQNWFERMMSGAQNKLGGAWGKTKELGSRFKEGAAPVFGLASLIGNATNPLNPKAFNYNPDLAPQLNFMDQQFPGMMTNNPSSGLLQYSDKVMLDGELVNNPLRGQAGMSLFGSNNPIGQLEKQINRHQKTIDNFANQWGNLKEDDIDAYNQKLNIHKNRLKNAKTLHDTLVGNKKAREAAAAKAAQAAHDAQMARSGITVSSGGYQGTGDRGRGGQGAFKEDVASMRSAGRSYTDAHGNTGYSRGRKDGGRIGYANGGLASLFTRRG